MSALEATTNAATPSAPPAGYLSLYPKSDGLWYYQNSAGVETLLAGGGVGDMIKATYDPTSVTGDAFSMDNMVEGALTKVLTATERTAITTNTAKVGITPAQVANIITNNAKVSDINHVTILLPNVDNTSDLNKPISLAQQTALDLKENSLGNPTVDGHVLSSTIAGVRSWTAGSGGGALNMPVVAHAVAYTALFADKGKALNCTNTWTLGLTAAATLGDGWTLAVNNSGTGTITLGTIGGTVKPNDSVLIGCDGTSFFIISDNRPTQYCTAWVNFNGITGAIRDSFNVASVVRTSIGKYAITIANAMTNANYSVNSSSSYSATSTNTLQIDNAIAQTVTTFHVINVGISFTDPSVANVSIFGGG